MRKSLIAAGVTLAVLAVPTEASAKGAAGLTIAADGRTWEVETSLMLIAEQSRFYESIWEPGVQAFSGADWVSSDDLGPRLVMSWDMDHDGSAPGPDIPVVQSLYPLAPGGPLVHTAEGQELYLEPLDGGWHRADPRLLDSLRRLGIANAAPERGAWFRT